MSGDCGHGWGWHKDGHDGPCYRCYEVELNRLKTYREVKILMSDSEVNVRIAILEDRIHGVRD